MRSTRKIARVSLIFAALILSFAVEARADQVQLTLTQTTYDMRSGSVVLMGFYTNSLPTYFTAHSWNIFLPQSLGPVGIDANTDPPNCCPYTTPVAPMSTSAILPLLRLSLFSSPPAGIYTGTLSFSGTTPPGLPIITNTVEFTLLVPTPEPATLILLGSGLAGAFAATRKRRRSSPSGK